MRIRFLQENNAPTTNRHLFPYSSRRDFFVHTVHKNQISQKRQQQSLKHGQHDAFPLATGGGGEPISGRVTRRCP